MGIKTSNSKILIQQNSEIKDFLHRPIDSRDTQSLFEGESFLLQPIPKPNPTELKQFWENKLKNMKFRSREQSIQRKIYPNLYLNASKKYRDPLNRLSLEEVIDSRAHTHSLNTPREIKRLPQIRFIYKGVKRPPIIRSSNAP